MYSSGDFSWGLGAEIPGVTPASILPSAPPPAPRLDDDEDIEDMEEDIQATVAHVTELFSALRGVLTPIFFRGIFAFLTWWVAACQLISSLFGIYFHQYLMHNWKVPWSKALCAESSSSRKPYANTYDVPTRWRLALLNKRSSKPIVFCRFLVESEDAS